jgi:hypothetical protein
LRADTRGNAGPLEETTVNNISLNRRQALAALAVTVIVAPRRAGATTEATLATVNPSAFLMVRMESLFA